MRVYKLTLRYQPCCLVTHQIPQYPVLLLYVSSSFFKKKKLLKVYSFAPYQDLTALSQRNLSFFRARGKRPALSDIIIIFNLATLSNGFVGCNGWSGVFVLKPIE